MEATMRITARGWGRNQGQMEIVNVALEEAISTPGPGNYYHSGQAYLDVENPYTRKLTTAGISAGTEQLRMGGKYLLKIELSRKEIAKLFFATHDGDIVQMFKSLLEDEEREAEEEERRREAEQRAAMLERHRQRMARNEKRELLGQVREKLASLNKRDGTAPAKSEAEPEPE
jgi:hypothetical protein